MSEGGDAFSFSEFDPALRMMSRGEPQTVTRESAAGHASLDPETLLAGPAKRGAARRLERRMRRSTELDSFGWTLAVQDA